MKSLLKITTDIFMFTFFIFLMFYNFTGEKAHKFLGIFLLFFTILHIFLNRFWYKNIFKGKYNFKRIFNIMGKKSPTSIGGVMNCLIYNFMTNVKEH